MSEAAGIELVIDQEAESKAPLCPHGPTLLFAKINRKEQEARRFYACAACRDRKDCNFFQWENEKVSVARQLAREEFNQSRQSPFTHKQYVERYQQFVSLPLAKRVFCLDCQLLLLPGEWSEHTSHHRLGDVSLHQLKRPSHLLLPLENKKTNAQYLFADRTCQFLLDLIVSLGFRRVLCVGTPRLHELIKLRQCEKKNPVIKSQLLDIDFRYSQFYSEEEFCHYNMFNHYFFGGKSAFEGFQTFLCQDNGESVIMVTDPPFGGLVEALAHSFKKIVNVWKTSRNKDDELPIFWIFPYFLEPRILQCFPNFSMLDYQVDYDNHALYKHGNSGRKQSPVRIFTNLPPKAIVLPAEEGYRYCSFCQRYISSANRHCEICQACTSKDGKEWKHCHICNKCVKPSWFHCETCSRCVLQDHSCGVAGSGCFNCGSTEHKRRECHDAAFQNKITDKSKPRKRKSLEMNEEGTANKSKQQGQERSMGKKKTFKRITVKSKRKQKRKNKQ
ncbi:LOW QUALITY PROTEIN: rRNA N6-adenosine-methyltransferase ZCCHC4 [Pristis pectinata]|uniref:LOW QUALITY PROTEIN: rRNA N6-adenosine-methyltransferase ZCCHC4 n=1 Tax=Pristis pectinata TaxID=685728 RepID=UPI00223E0B39|nr:LOW QUALITY PROTEIN: rRNA N6-adenosine-methyltransferase ZCCHC4 [Pristis pectinata]